MLEKEMNKTTNEAKDKKVTLLNFANKRKDTTKNVVTTTMIATM